MAMVVKLGGSVFMGDHGPKIGLVRDVVDSLGREHAYVIGGGRMARLFYRNCGLSGRDAEECLVKLMHSNVCSLSKLLGLKPVYSENDFSFSSIASSLRPGMSSDGVAALIAEALSAEMLVILTNVPGILDDGGKVIRRIGFDEIAKMGHDEGVCKYWVIDSVAREVISRSRIPTVVGRWEGSLGRLMESGTIVGDI